MLGLSGHKPQPACKICSRLAGKGWLLMTLQHISKAEMVDDCHSQHRYGRREGAQTWAAAGTFGLPGPAGHDHLDAGHMREERFWRLRVIMPAMSHSTCRQAQ